MADEIKNENEERDIITLTDDNGKEVQCEFVDTVEYNGKLYCVVEPLESDEDYEEGSCYIFLLKENDDESVDLFPVESDEELNAVFEKFLANCEEEGCDGNCEACSGCPSDKND